MFLKESLNKNWCLYIFIILWLILQAVQLDGEWSLLDNDVAQYILHAKSLIDNGQYNSDNFIFIYGATNSPLSAQPGMPLILVPFLFIFGYNLLVMKLLIIGLALLSGILLKRYLQIKLGNKALSVLLTGIYFFSMTTIVYTRIIYSEWPYLLLSLLILYMLIDENFYTKSPFKFVIIGICLSLAYLFRSVAFSLYLAVVVVIVHSIFIKYENWRGVTLRLGLLIFSSFIIYLGTVLFLQMEKGEGYLDFVLAKDLFFLLDGKASFGDILLRIPINGLYYVKNFAPLILGRNWHELLNYYFTGYADLINGIVFLGGGAFFIITIIGFFKKILWKPTVLEYYIFLYLLMISLVWINIEAFRYLMPILPFILYYFALGISAILKKLRWNQKRADNIILIIFSSLLFLNVIHSGIEVYRYKFSFQKIENLNLPYKQTARWLKENIGQDNLIITEKTCWYALETGARVTSYLKSRNIDKAFRFLLEYPNSIIVYDKKLYVDRECLKKVIEKHNNHFKPLVEFGHIKIFKILPLVENMIDEGINHL